MNAREVFYITDHNGAYLNAAGAFSVFGVAQHFGTEGEALAIIDSLPLEGFYQIQKFFYTRP